MPPPIIHRPNPHPYPHPLPHPIPPPIIPLPPVDDGDFPVITQLKAGSVILPLHGLSVVVSVNQYVAEVQVLQRFVNMESNPIEAMYIILFLPFLVLLIVFLWNQLIN